MRFLMAVLVAVAFIAIPTASNSAYAAELSTIENTDAIQLADSLFVMKGSVPEQSAVQTLTFHARHGLTPERILSERDAEQARIDTLQSDLVVLKRLEKKRNHVDTTGFDWIYMEAEEEYGVPWQVLSAVHQTETGRRGDTGIASYAGAQGPMQFMPGTWRAYGQDGDGDGIANVNDVDDAIHGAANYLRANGAANGNVRGALYHYNHSTAYVNLVLSRAYAVGYTGQ